MIHRGAAERTLPAAVEAAVYSGVDWVQLRERALDGARLLAFAEETVPEDAAVPKYLEVMDELPKTAVGKIFKPALRKLAIAPRPRPSAPPVPLRKTISAQGWPRRPGETASAPRPSPIRSIAS